MCEQLSGGCIGYGPFAPATGHGTRSEVRDKRHQCIDARGARLEEIDKDEPRKAFGQSLCKSARQRHRTCRTGLPGRTDLRNHAGAHRLGQDADPVCRKGKRRNSVDNDGHAEWSAAVPVFSTQGSVEHLDDRSHMGWIGEADTDGFRCSLDAGKGRVHIEFKRRLHVPSDQRADPVVDVGRSVENTHHCIEVGQRAVAECACFCVEHLDGGSPGSDVDPFASNLEVMLFGESRKVYDARRAFQGGLDHRSGEANTSVVAEASAEFG